MNTHFPNIVLPFLFLLLSFSASAQSQQSEHKTPDKETLEKKAAVKKLYFTKKIETASPVIDADLNDPAWQTVEWGGDFTQRQPYEGNDPTQKTSFKILYDAKNLYIAYRAHDTEPDKIVKRLSRRDGFEGDWVEINIDSYFDHRTAFSFTISASGVKGDEFISNDGNNWDGSWDPIWYVKTKVDEEGWIAEIKIPLSQLRFANKDEHVWGIQVQRRDFRMEERSVWQYIPRNSASWVSSFGELHGLVGIMPQKQVEIQPYIVAKAETFEKEEGNPFVTGSSKNLSAGIDGKIGVTSDLTVDFTINPDFGQVEADPSALALDGYQVFFQEKRPFFIEGRNIYNYQITSAATGGPFNSDVLFYSRRIGGAPHGYPDLNDGEYMSRPDNTSILGAAKFSGKTQNGLSIGVLESVTQKEYAKIDRNGERSTELIEPLSNYFVGRLQQDLDGGNTVFGGMFTAVNRDDLANTNLNYLHQSAYSGGLDFLHRWKKQLWYFSANSVFSRVNGSTEAITDTQKRFEHNFQRIDSKHVHLDTTRTSLIGHGGALKLGRTGGGKKLNFEGGVSWRSPELELNDLGFLRSTDEIIHFLWAGYRIDKPFSIFNNLRVNYNHWAATDFNGLPLYLGWNMNSQVTFTNNYGAGTGFNYNFYDVSTKALRGGPTLRLGQSFNNWMYFSTDSRKKLFFNWNMFHQWGTDNKSTYKNYNVYMTFRPMNTLEIAVGPNLDINHDVMQFVDNIDINENETRYLNATIDQKTLSMTVNVNYTINPNLSIQYYGSPFISRGRYSEFKYITDATAKAFDQRFQAYRPDQVSYNSGEESYYFSENNTGQPTFSIGNPDFNFMEFRSNLVVRWEYIPGSEIYLVWSQGVSNNGNPGDDLLPSLRENLFTEKAHNIFLVKYTYRFIK